MIRTISFASAVVFCAAPSELVYRADALNLKLHCGFKGSMFNRFSVRAASSKNEHIVGDGEHQDAQSEALYDDAVRVINVLQSKYSSLYSQAELGNLNWREAWNGLMEGQETMTSQGERQIFRCTGGVYAQPPIIKINDYLESITKNHHNRNLRLTMQQQETLRSLQDDYASKLLAARKIETYGKTENFKRRMEMLKDSISKLTNFVNTGDVFSVEEPMAAPLDVPFADFAEPMVVPMAMPVEDTLPQTEERLQRLENKIDALSVMLEQLLLKHSVIPGSPLATVQA